MTVQILGLRTTVYRVTDMPKAREWYGKAFGTAPYFDEDFYIGFNIAGYELGLLPEEETRFVDKEAGDKEAGDKGANVLSYWGVEDIHEAQRHFLSLGATTLHPPTDVGDKIWTLEMLDPWGNVIGLIKNPNFKL